jgi:phosphoenolpyruvate carboxylase
MATVGYCDDADDGGLGTISARGSQGDGSCGVVAMAEADLADSDDKNRQLRDDIRLLGRILGDTLRAQNGQVVFDTVENIRQNAVRFHRDEDKAARRALEDTLNRLAPDDALQIIRAFGFFSHLANIAEDQHQHWPAPRPTASHRNGCGHF